MKFNALYQAYYQIYILFLNNLQLITMTTYEVKYFPLQVSNLNSFEVSLWGKNV